MAHKSALLADLQKRAAGIGLERAALLYLTDPAQVMQFMMDFADHLLAIERHSPENGETGMALAISLVHTAGLREPEAYERWRTVVQLLPLLERPMAA